MSDHLEGHVLGDLLVAEPDQVGRIGGVVVAHQHLGDPGRNAPGIRSSTWESVDAALNATTRMPIRAGI